ncbi:hypothetical protein [Massilia sp. 9096]|uniref:hypothetical protein n=1 Tax=Massilia sp. 9096 TaxID=1500894 RepID=UPI00056AE174|nr:hypothetical protein [Massilia sp. 9096]
MSTVLRSIRAAYCTQAVVDWLALEIETARPTQFQWLQRTLADHFGDGKRTYIDSIDADASGATTRFLVRLNDDHCRTVDTVRAALAALDQRHTLVGPALVKLLEVSLDFYPKDDQARAYLPLLVARLQTSLEAAGGTSHRLVGPTKRAEHLDSTDTPDPRRTLYINNKLDPLAWRVYYKITDRDQTLPRDQHRARVEFTLQGVGLHQYGINTVDDLAALDFGDFGHLLHFRQFKPLPDLIANMKPELAQLVQHATRRDRNMISLYPFGLHAYRRYNTGKHAGKPRNGGHPELRKHSTHTTADAELNQLVRNRLHDLTQFFTQNWNEK